MKPKDYQAIAEIIRSLEKNHGLRDKVAEHFSERLWQNNSRFNKAKFLKATGFSEQQDDDE